MSESLHIVCPQCRAANRVPGARLGERPLCGSCKTPLFRGEPLDLGVDTFDAHLQRSELPLLVDCWAPWCGPCLMMAPQFAAAAEALEPQLRLAKVNTQVEPTLAQRFGIRSIPTMILFAGGQELGRHAGAMPAADIVNWARSTLRTREG